MLRPAVRLSLLLGSLFALGCGFPKTTSAPPPPVSPADATGATARWPEATPDRLAAGRALFVARCNGCHGYPDVASVPEDRWPGIVKEMAPKAKLSPAEGDDVLHFVLAARGR
jgi:mono/diheme cytochrome c family protein